MRNEASPYGPATREVLSMFPYGNFADYWLGTAAYDNTRLADQPGWVDVERIIRRANLRELLAWTPERLALEQLIRESPDRVNDRAGGLTGVASAYWGARAGLMALGEAALAAEERTR